MLGTYELCPIYSWNCFGSAAVGLEKLSCLQPSEMLIGENGRCCFFYLNLRYIKAQQTAIFSQCVFAGLQIRFSNIAGIFSYGKYILLSSLLDVGVWEGTDEIKNRFQLLCVGK